MVYYVALSGGIDSIMTLLFAHEKAKSKNTNVIALHVNHNIQPDISEQWSDYCKKVCEYLRIPLFIKELNYKENDVDNIENWARIQRHNYFKTFVTEADVLMTGHHKDDQVETVLLKLFRGSVDGLTGMSQESNYGNSKIFRPFLKNTKKEIKENLLSKVKEYKDFPQFEDGNFWVTDYSNYEETFDRNFLRNNVIPSLEKRFPNIKNNISDVGEHLEEKYKQLNNYVQREYIEYSEIISLGTVKIRPNESIFTSELKVITTFVKSILDENNFQIRKNNLLQISKNIQQQKEGILDLAGLYFSYEQGNFYFLKKSNLKNNNFPKKQKIDGVFDKNFEDFNKPIKLSEYYRTQKTPKIIRDYLPIINVGEKNYIVTEKGIS